MNAGFWQGIVLGLATGVSTIAVIVSFKLECARRASADKRERRQLARWRKRGSS